MQLQLRSYLKIKIMVIFLIPIIMVQIVKQYTHTISVSQEAGALVIKDFFQFSQCLHIGFFYHILQC